MDCKNEQIHAYYDGELAPSERAAVESHLVDCADCRELLADLRSVSQLVATAPMVEITPVAMKRMQQAWWAAQDRGVLRIASWLSAVAAAVIFAAVIFSPSQRSDTTPGAGTNWQMVALTPPMPVEDEPQQQDEVIDAAQWIANDLALAMR